MPFPLCISAETAEQYGAAFVDDVSVALGNIVLADHGAEIEEPLGTVPEDTVGQVLLTADGAAAEVGCRRGRTVMAPARFRPQLRRGPLMQAAPVDLAAPAASASAALRFRASDAVPAISIHDGTSEPWRRGSIF